MILTGKEEKSVECGVWSLKPRRVRGSAAKKIKLFFRRHVRRKNSFGRSLCKPLAPTKAGKARRDKREYLKKSSAQRTAEQMTFYGIGCAEGSISLYRLKMSSRPFLSNVLLYCSWLNRFSVAASSSSA